MNKQTFKTVGSRIQRFLDKTPNPSKKNIRDFARDLLVDLAVGEEAGPTRVLRMLIPIGNGTVGIPEMPLTVAHGPMVAGLQLREVALTILPDGRISASPINETQSWRLENEP